ncbi:outer membrane protein OmpA-like peptidoglycan-associated protein [Elusimicrobium simillimum]|uniref:OmpA family protein n=1 Tax=Elusimicrobium simillimum TaxID=3143438 RepID=UPI003C6ED1E0
MKKTLVLLSVVVFLAACSTAAVSTKKACDKKPCKSAKCDVKKGQDCKPKCHPFKNVPCERKVVKPVARPVPPAPVRQAPRQIASEDLGTVASVRSTGAATQRIVFNTPILFETNSDKLKAESNEPIKKLAGVLKKYPNAHTTVEGYTDSIGDPAYNVDLSERRAKAVVAKLQSEGVSEANLSAKGYGAANPIADNKTKEGRAKNRRVELDIVNK